MIYPRTCDLCKKSYGSASSYTDHKSKQRCYPNAPSKRSSGRSTSVINQNNSITNSNNNSNNTIIINVTPNELPNVLQTVLHSRSDATDTSASPTSKSKRTGHQHPVLSAVEQKALKDVFDRESISTSAQLQSLILKFEKSWRELLFQKFNMRLAIHNPERHVDFINAIIEQCNLPIKRNKQNKQVVALKPDDLLNFLSKEIWLRLFLPSIDPRLDYEDAAYQYKDTWPPDQSKILKHLIERPIRVNDTMSSSRCEVRVNNEEGASSITSRYAWVCQDWGEAILPSFQAVHAVLLTTIKGMYTADSEKEIDAFVADALRDHLKDDQNNSNRVYMPDKIKRDLISAMINDSKNNLVGGWRTFADAFGKEQKENANKICL